jgi:coenzyme PQQ precursor peptide PqqA
MSLPTSGINSAHVKAIAPSMSANPFSKNRETERAVHKVRVMHGLNARSDKSHADQVPMKLSPELETTMNEWLKPYIQEMQAGMEVTSYLPAGLDFA